MARLFRQDEAYELHIDEASYTDAATALAAGDGLQMFGLPFHLHPPGYFVVLAGVQRLLGLEGDRIVMVEAFRPVGAVIGALTCLLLLLLVRRVTGSVLTGLLAGLLLAVDPFSNRWDSRVFLEAPAMLWTVAAVTLLVVATGRARAGGPLVLLAGACVAGAILTKEPYALLTALPVLVLLVTGWCLDRRDSAAVLAVAVTGYLGYVAVIASTGQWGAWREEKLSGVERLVGLSHPTGFNAEDAEPVSGPLLDNLTSYGPSYALVVLGALGSAYLLLRLAPWRRGRPPTPEQRATLLLVVWQVCATGYVSYAVLLGTLEEQTFYLLLAPGAAVTAVAARALHHDRSGHRGAGLVGVLMAGLLLAQTGSWALIHSREDHGYLTTDAWFAENLPAGTRVAMTEDTGQFLLRGVDISTAADVPALRAERADFVLVSTELAGRGYGLATEELVQELDETSTLVLSTPGPSLGELRLYDVRELTGGSGVADGLTLPPA